MKYVNQKNKSIGSDIRKIAKKYNVSVSRDSYNCENNEGACAGKNIYLGEFDNHSIEIVAFFHELGHALSNELVCKRGCTMTRVSSEGLAWELGLGLAFDNGYKWGHDSPEMKYARERFRTYNKEEHYR